MHGQIPVGRPDPGDLRGQDYALTETPTERMPAQEMANVLHSQARRFGEFLDQLEHGGMSEPPGLKAEREPGLMDILANTTDIMAAANLRLERIVRTIGRL